MPRNSRSVICCVIVFLLFSATVRMESATAASESTPQAIDFLIDTVAQSHLTFIRNGEKHTCSEAAEHMQRKYDYFKSKVKTPEDFICLCASKSILSGKPYMVVTGEGTVPVAKWLEQKLAKHENSLNFH